MSTRSDIIVHRADDTWARIYCHWDGYPEHNGAILAEHYADQATADALVALGDLSSLGPKIGTKHDFDWQRKFYGKSKDTPKFKRLSEMCNAYGRDRGEPDTEASVSDSLAAAWPDSNCGTEYTYVFDGGVWYVGDPDEGSQSLVLLADVLRGYVTIHSAVKAFGGNFVIGRH